MSLENIQHKTASQIQRCIKTNSVPFELLCEDGDIYFAKTTFVVNPPLCDLINEIICNYLLKCWGVLTAVPVIIDIPQSIYDSYVHTDNYKDPRYGNYDFDRKQFFGVKRIEATELELYNSTFKNRADYNNYSSPKDLLKIGIFDRWIGNNDRRVKNPNILLTQNGRQFDFVAIDHTEVFGYQTNYKALNPAIMNTSRPDSILSTNMSRSIINFGGLDLMRGFEDEILECIERSIESLDFIFEQIPSAFGLSDKGKLKIKEVLSLKERNEQLARLLLN